MLIKLETKLIKRLLEQPESGMGYQKVNVTLKNGVVIKDAIVYNAEDLELPVRFNLTKNKDIVKIELTKDAVLTK